MLCVLNVCCLLGRWFGLGGLLMFNSVDLLFRHVSSLLFILLLAVCVVWLIALCYCCFDGLYCLLLSALFV